MIVTLQERHRTVDVVDEEEDGRKTCAETRLRTRDDTCLRGGGPTRRDPNDGNVPGIGEELAVARKSVRSFRLR